MCQGQRLEELGLPSPRPHRRVMGLIRLEPFLEKLQIQVHRCLLVVFASWERSPKSRIRTVDVWYFEVSEARGWGFGSIQWWKQGSKKMTRQDKGTNKGHFPSSFFFLLLFLISSFPDVIQFNELWKSRALSNFKAITTQMTPKQDDLIMARL